MNSDTLNLKDDSMEPVIHGILEYSLKPYANLNNIDIKDLIQKLYDYYQLGIANNLFLENDLKINCDKEYVANENRHSESSMDLTSNNQTIPVKRGRGRPKGSKNKRKDNIF